MDESHPLRGPSPAPAHRDNTKTPSALSTRLKNLISEATREAPDSGIAYEVHPLPIVLAWLSAIAVLGLSAYVVNRADPGTALQGAAIFNLVMGIAGTLFTLGLDIRFPRSKSKSDSRPSTGSYIFILAKGVIWLGAAAALFATVGADERGYAHTKRRYGGGGGSGGAGPVGVESISIGCSFMGILIFLCTLYFWKHPMVALFQRYSEQERRKMYAKLLSA